MLTAKRKSVLPTEKQNADNALHSQLARWRLERIAGGWSGTIAVFFPLPGEPDLHALYDSWCAEGQKLALPVVTQRHQALAFSLWKPGAPLVRDMCGISVPADFLAVEPDVILAPCLGFTHQRYRLGYGGGYYDRTLPSLPHAFKIGVCYSDTRVDMLPADHDIPFDLIVTEQGLL